MSKNRLAYLTDEDRRNGFKEYKVPVNLTVFAKSKKKAIENINNTLLYSLNDVWHYEKTGPIEEIKPL